MLSGTLDWDICPIKDCLKCTSYILILLLIINPYVIYVILPNTENWLILQVPLFHLLTLNYFTLIFEVLLLRFPFMVIGIFSLLLMNTVDFYGPYYSKPNLKFHLTLKNLFTLFKLNTISLLKL